MKLEFDKVFNLIADNSDYINIMTYDYYSHFQEYYF